MCIYCGTNKYRKIYENHNGSIPRDSLNRSYHIHHIDGNRENNNPENLVAVSIEEHYKIHFNQGDYAACHRLSKLLNLSNDEMSSLSRLAQQQRVANGTHNFLGGEIQKERVKNGTHHLLSGKIQSQTNKRLWANGTHPVIASHLKRLENGTYKQWAIKSNAERLANGTHNWTQAWTCSFCNKSGKNQSLFHRWGHHDGSCLDRRDYVPPTADKTIYTWKNVVTGEMVNLTRREMAKKYNISPQSLCDLVSKRKPIAKNWSLISD